MGVREDRLEQKLDRLIEQTALYTLVFCEVGMHKGYFIAWSAQGKILRTAKTESFVRKGLPK